MKENENQNINENLNSEIVDEFEIIDGPEAGGNANIQKEEEPDIEINIDGDFRFDGQEKEAQIQEEELYFENNPVQINPEINENPTDNLFQGILAEEELNSWEDMEQEAKNLKEEQLAKENQLKAQLVAKEEARKKEEQAKKEAEEKKIAEEKKKAEEKAAKKKEEEAKKKEEEAKKKEEEVPKRTFVTPYEQGVAEYYSEQRGYKDMDIKDGFTQKQAEEVHVMKYTAREIFQNSGTVRMSAGQKKLMKDLEAFDQFMKEIDGRTKLTPREMEVYDKLSLKVYKSGKEYREYLEQKHKKLKEAYDEKHKNDEYKMEYQPTPLDNAKLEVTNKLLETVERMRKEAFEKEIEEKTKELTEKCQKEAQSAEAVRDQMLSVRDTPENTRALQHNMEESIARTLYYNNRIEQLKKKGELSIKPDESFSKAMQRLDKSIQPTPKELDEIKSGELCKTLVKKGNEKLKEKDVLTAEEIKESQKEYIKAEGSNLAMRKWRESNMKKPEVKKQNEAEKQKELKQPMTPGM